MKKRAAAFVLALLMALLLCANGYAAGGSAESNAKQAVEEAFTMLNKQDRNLPGRLTVLSAEKVEQFSSGRSWDTYFMITDATLTADEENGDIVNYVCSVPSPVCVALNIVFGARLLGAEKLSPRFEMSGSYSMAKTKSGDTRISVNDNNDPISLYMNLSYPNREFTSYRKPGTYKDTEEMSAALAEAYQYVMLQYIQVLGVEHEAVQRASDDLGACMQNLAQALQSPSKQFVSPFPPQPNAVQVFFDGIDQSIKDATAGWPVQLNLLWACIIVAACVLVPIIAIKWGKYSKREKAARKERMEKKAQAERKKKAELEEFERGYIEAIAGKAAPDADEYYVKWYKTTEDSSFISDVKDSPEIAEATKGIVVDDQPDVSKWLKLLREAEEKELKPNDELLYREQLPDNTLSVIESKIKVKDIEQKLKDARTTARYMSRRKLAVYSYHLRYLLMLAMGKTEDFTRDMAAEIAKPLGALLKTHQTNEEITLAGWAAAALGRYISQNVNPDELQGEIDKFNSIVDEFNDEVEGLKKTEDELQAFIRTLSAGFDGRVTLSGENAVKYEKLNTMRESHAAIVAAGIAAYAINQGASPIGYLAHLLTDSAQRYPPFVRQGVIMGLLDYLLKNKAHPVAGKLLEQLVATRASLIQSAQEMSFFEVRVPCDCKANEYAEILRFVLYVANPSLKYADTGVTMQAAVNEIPGVMRLLCNYPLRIIDPQNDTKEGFFSFEPFKHAMWTQYQPPLNVGQVISRYHQVLDMTIPNATALHTRLFMRPYALIPVLFHEYCHFRGDPNEASVFLRTQLFSRQFYREHPDAQPAKDATFVTLQALLGTDIKDDKAEPLNKLIVKYYGEAGTEAQGQQKASLFIAGQNEMIKLRQALEKWHPEVWFPLLETEDKENGELIRKILVRYTQTPRTITRAQFKQLLKKWMPEDKAA